MLHVIYKSKTQLKSITTHYFGHYQHIKFSIFHHDLRSLEWSTTTSTSDTEHRHQYHHGEGWKRERRMNLSFSPFTPCGKMSDVPTTICLWHSSSLPLPCIMDTSPKTPVLRESSKCRSNKNQGCKNDWDGKWKPIWNLAVSNSNKQNFSAKIEVNHESWLQIMVMKTIFLGQTRIKNFNKIMKMKTINWESWLQIMKIKTFSN